MDWKDNALCGTVASTNPDMADAWISETTENAPAARAVCAACTVRRECALRAVLYERQAWGMRGGFYFRGGTLVPPEARQFLKEFQVRPPTRAKIFHAEGE